MDPVVGQITLGVYAALLGLGGAIGYLKAGSKPSLVAGVASALFAVICLLAVRADPLIGLWLGAGLATLLLIFFGFRFAKSRKFMPSGLMVLVSVLVLVLMVVCSTQIRI